MREAAQSWAALAGSVRWARALNWSSICTTENVLAIFFSSGSGIYCAPQVMSSAELNETMSTVLLDKCHGVDCEWFIWGVDGELGRGSGARAQRSMRYRNVQLNGQERDPARKGMIFWGHAAAIRVDVSQVLQWRIIVGVAEATFPMPAPGLGLAAPPPSSGICGSRPSTRTCLPPSQIG